MPWTRNPDQSWKGKLKPEEVVQLKSIEADLLHLAERRKELLQQRRNIQSRCRMRVTFSKNKAAREELERLKQPKRERPSIDDGKLTF